MWVPLGDLVVVGVVRMDEGMLSAVIVDTLMQDRSGHIIRFILNSLMCHTRMPMQWTSE